MRKVLTFVFIPVLIFPVIISAASSIMIHNAWIRSAPPNAKALAAYMMIENGSHEPRTLTAVSSKLFRKIEIHRTEMHEGIAKMIPQKQLVIPADGSVVLEPGGYHLMLIDPETVPREGEQVDMELRFDDGEILHIKAPVRAGGETGNLMDKHHH